MFAEYSSGDGNSNSGLVGAVITLSIFLCIAIIVIAMLLRHVLIVLPQRKNQEDVTKIAESHAYDNPDCHEMVNRMINSYLIFCSSLSYPHYVWLLFSYLTKGV